MLGSGVESFAEPLLAALTSGERHLLERSIQLYQLFGIPFERTSFGPALREAYAAVAFHYLQPDGPFDAPILTALLTSAEAQFQGTAAMILEMLDFLPIHKSVAILQFFAGLSERDASVREVATAAASRLAVYVCDVCKTESPRFDCVECFVAVFAAASADPGVFWLCRWATDIMNRIQLPGELLRPVVRLLHFLCRLHDGYDRELEENPTELWFSAYEFSALWANVCDRMRALDFFHRFVDQFGLENVLECLYELPVDGPAAQESLMRIVAFLIEIRRDEAILPYAIQLLQTATDDVLCLTLGRAFLMIQILPFLQPGVGLDWVFDQAIELSRAFINQEQTDVFPLLFTFGCGLIERLMHHCDIPAEIFVLVHTSWHCCLSLASANVLCWALRAGKFPILPNEDLSLLLDDFARGLDELGLEEDGELPEANSGLLRQVEAPVRLLKTIVEVHAGPDQLQWAHQLIQSAFRPLCPDAVATVCSLVGACLKTCLNLHSGDGFEVIVVDLFSCWKCQSDGALMAVDFFAPLFAAFEGGWTAADPAVRLWLFDFICTERVFLLNDGMVADSLEPADAISVLTFLCRLFQSFGEEAQARLPVFDSLLPLTEVVVLLGEKEEFIGQLLRIEIELSKMFVGVRIREDEFGRFLEGVAASNAIIANYHRRLLFLVLARARDSYPNLGEIIDSMAQAVLLGVLACEEAVRALRGTEFAEVFDKYGSPVSEIEIEGFINLDLWD
jgi:hypothetical protein